MDKKYRLVTTAEAKEIFDNEMEIRKDLSNEQKYAREHAQRFGILKAKEANKLVEELMETVPKVKEHLAYKLTDFLPEHPDDVRVVFSRERFTLGDDEIKQILDIVKKYSPKE